MSGEVGKSWENDKVDSLLDLLEQMFGALNPVIMGEIDAISKDAAESIRTVEDYLVNYFEE